jgi:hypothetical protein
MDFDPQQRVLVAAGAAFVVVVMAT